MNNPNHPKKLENDFFEVVSKDQRPQKMDQWLTPKFYIWDKRTGWYHMRDDMTIWFDPEESIAISYAEELTDDIAFEKAVLE
jgi:hypothetical protein